ncbi:MAG: glycosyltransferase family 4 protein [Saprospiraceae bacterium]
MTVLHLFDLYLPHTMNWAWRTMQAIPDTEQWVASPWILDNEYHSPQFRFFRRPLQQIAGLFPKHEQQAAWFSTNLIRAERHWPLYKNWLFKQLKNRRPDVLHAHFGSVGCHFLDLAQRLNIPLVCSFYGYDYTRIPFEKTVYRTRYRQLFEGASAITTTGALTPILLIDQGCPRSKIIPIPLSISPGQFPFFDRKKIQGQLRLVQIATFTHKKGHMDTLAAFKIALRSCPQAQLTFAGERQDKTVFREIQKYIKINDLEQNVRVRDFVEHHQLSQFLQQFDVFIHPSRTTENRDCEGAPAVILEAMSTGLPTIATDHSDIPEQVQHGRTGLLAPEYDPARLATFIERFYQMDNPEYQQMSRAARTRVEQYFDVNKTAHKLRALYQKACC